MADTYNPCHNGIHVCGCGVDRGYDVPTTVANFPGASEWKFDELEQHYALAEDEDPDLIVDLVINGDIIRDFGIRRQSLAALSASV